MRWKIILAVAAVAVATAGIAIPRPDGADQPGQIAMTEVGD